MAKRNIGRNDACHCGSGTKYKRCCLEKDSLEILERSRQLFQDAFLEELGDDFGLKAFHEFFPEIAESENRVFWSQDRRPPEREPYQMIEYFCDDPTCDCNRVVIGVLDREKSERGTILSVGYAFDRNDPDAGPYIDPLNPLTSEGRSIFPVVENMLETDLEYVARLKRHYNLVKRKVRAPLPNDAPMQPLLT